MARKKISTKKPINTILRSVPDFQKQARESSGFSKLLKGRKK